MKIDAKAFSLKFKLFWSEFKKTNLNTFIPKVQSEIKIVKILYTIKPKKKKIVEYSFTSEMGKRTLNNETKNTATKIASIKPAATILK